MKDRQKKRQDTQTTLGCFNSNVKLGKQASPKNSETRKVNKITFDNTSELPFIQMQLLHPIQSTSI